MSTFNLKSTALQNRDATPKVLTDAYVDHGECLESQGYVQTGSAADGVGSTYRLCSVPSNARVSQLLFQCDALGAGGVIKIGVFYPTFIPVGSGLSAANASAAIADNLFANALAVNAALALGDYTNQSGNYTIAKQEMPLWQAAGLTADPGIDLDIVATVTTILAAQGYLGAKARYIKQ